MLSIHLRLSLLNRLLPFGFPTYNLYAALLSTIRVLQSIFMNTRSCVNGLCMSIYEAVSKPTALRNANSKGDYVHTSTIEINKTGENGNAQVISLYFTRKQSIWRVYVTRITHTHTHIYSPWTKITTNL
jgi:hypothetical protein